MSFRNDDFLEPPLNILSVKKSGHIFQSLRDPHDPMYAASDTNNREDTKTEKDHADTMAFIQLSHPHGTG